MTLNRDEASRQIKEQSDVAASGSGKQALEREWSPSLVALYGEPNVLVFP